MENLKEHRQKFSEEKYALLKENISRHMRTAGVETLKEQEILAQYTLYDEPSELNGYQVLNLTKLGAIMACFAQHHTVSHTAEDSGAIRLSILC